MARFCHKSSFSLCINKCFSFFLINFAFVSINEFNELSTFFQFNINNLSTVSLVDDLLHVCLLCWFYLASVMCTLKCISWFVVTNLSHKSMWNSFSIDWQRHLANRRKEMAQFFLYNNHRFKVPNGNFFLVFRSMHTSDKINDYAQYQCAFNLIAFFSLAAGFLSWASFLIRTINHCRPLNPFQGPFWSSNFASICF